MKERKRNDEFLFVETVRRETPRKQPYASCIGGFTFNADAESERAWEQDTDTLYEGLGGMGVSEKSHCRWMPTVRNPTHTRREVCHRPELGCR